MTQDPKATAVEAVRELCRHLAGVQLSALPFPELALVSLFSDDEYENHDYDLIPPEARRKVHLVARSKAWSLSGSRRLEDPATGARLVFPRPGGVLGASPLDEVERTLEEERGAWAFATPTQVILRCLSRGSDRAGPLEDLVYTQPANFTKIDELAKDLGAGATWQRWRPHLAARQDAGNEDRRRRRRKVSR